MTGFVYIWRDRKRKMFYIGSHWGPEDDGYICSSNRMRDAYRRRPEDFKRRILETNIQDRKNLLENEEKWLKKAENKKERYYNLHFTTHHWHSSQNLSEKMSINHWSKNPKYAYLKKQFSEMYTGKTATIETKIKISLSQKGLKRTEEQKKKFKENHYSKKENFIPSMLGKKHSEETKLKMRNKHLGKKISEETKVKMSNSNKNRVVSEKTKLKMKIAQNIRRGNI